MHSSQSSSLSTGHPWTKAQVGVYRRPLAIGPDLLTKLLINDPAQEGTNPDLSQGPFVLAIIARSVPDSWVSLNQWPERRVEAPPGPGTRLRRSRARVPSPHHPFGVQPDQSRPPQGRTPRAPGDACHGAHRLAAIADSGRSEALPRYRSRDRATVRADAHCARRA